MVDTDAALFAVPARKVRNKQKGMTERVGSTKRATARASGAPVRCHNRRLLEREIFLLRNSDWTRRWYQRSEMEHLGLEEPTFCGNTGSLSLAHLTNAWPNHNRTP